MDRCYANTQPTRHTKLPVVLTEREVVNIKQKLMKQKTLVHWIQLSGARFLYNATTVFIPYKFEKTYCSYQRMIWHTLIPSYNFHSSFKWKKKKEEELIISKITVHHPKCISNDGQNTSSVELSMRSASVVKCESLKRLSGLLSIILSSSAE